MFERLDPQAGLIVQAGMAEAHRYGHRSLGTEHLLLGALTHPELLPPAARHELPADIETVRRQLERELSTDPCAPSDAALLASLGIDLATVRSRAGDTFGTDAVQRAARRESERRRKRRRRRAYPRRGCFPVLADGLGVMPRVKQAFERAAKRADALGQPTLTANVLVSAILEDDRAMAPRLLRQLGIDPARARAALDATGS